MSSQTSLVDLENELAPLENLFARAIVDSGLVASRGRTVYTRDEVISLGNELQVSVHDDSLGGVIHDTISGVLACSSQLVSGARVVDLLLDIRSLLTESTDSWIWSVKR
jgi:hypothetical protein